MPYYVNIQNVTPDEPSSGWYYSIDDKIFGPFDSKHEALDSESEGAYSEHIQDEQEALFERDSNKFRGSTKI